MPDIVVYPYGPNKPVRIRWQSDTMPTDQDIEDIYASFAKGEVGKPAVKAPVNTGRMPSPLEGRLGKPPTTGYAPVAPFTPGNVVQDNSGKPVPKQAVTNPNIVRDRPAPKGIGFTAADYPASKVPAKAPVVPSKQVPITNPALQQFGQPNVAQQLQKSIDIKTPEGKANAKKAYKDQPSKLTVPTKGKATVQVQGNASGSFTIPGIGPVRWVQRGPGFVADVPGLGTVMAPDPQSLAKKIHQGFVDVSLKAKTPAASPNYAESEQQSQDFYTNQNQNLTAEERASAKARQARATAKDPMRMSLTNPASIIMGAGEHIPGMVATSAGPVLAMLGGATPEEMQFLARRQTVKQADANVAAQMVKYLIPGTMNAQWTADIAKGVVRSLDDLGKGKWETALTEIAGQAGLPAALHGLSYIKPLIRAWKKFRSGEGSLDAFIAATDKMGLDANRKAAVIDAIKSDPNLGFKGFTPEGKPIFSVKSDVGPVEQVAKVDHAAEIAAKKAELDARRAARKAETEGPLRQGQGIKVNGQQAEVVGVQGDTVTIRYQDGQVRDVKKSKLNAKPEPTPDATTQPVPPEPKPVSTGKISHDDFPMDQVGFTALSISSSRGKTTISVHPAWSTSSSTRSVKIALSDAEQTALDAAHGLGMKESRAFFETEMGQGIMRKAKAASDQFDHRPVRVGDTVKTEYGTGVVTDGNADRLAMTLPDGETKTFLRSEVDDIISRGDGPTKPAPVSEPSVTAPKAKEPVQNVTGGVKEPWQMTREELAKKQMEADNAPSQASGLYKDNIDGLNKQIDDHLAALSDDKILERNRRTGETLDQTRARVQQSLDYLNRNGHKAAVESALKEGKPVPPEVLADYPDLAAKYGKKESAVSTQDVKGNAETVYHGSGNTDAIRKSGFTYDYVGIGNDQYGPGFYFTSDKSVASGYTTRRGDLELMKPGGEGTPGVLESSVELKNPIRLDASIHNNVDDWPTLSSKQASQMISTLTKGMSDDALANWGDVSFVGRDNVLREMVRMYTGDSPATLIYDLSREGLPIEKGLRLYSKLSGHDGVVVTFPSGEKHTVAWFPEQIKIHESPKAPTPNTPKPVEAPQKPVQAPETGNVKAHDVIRKGWVGDYPTLTSTSRVKGTDGKWYSTREVLPRGVERTDEIQTAWGVKTSDGTTTPFQGRSYKTKEDLESAIAAAFEKKNKEVDNFLATATTEKIASQREYWEQQLFLKNWRKGIDADPPLFAGTEFRLGDKVKIPGDKREYFVSGRESGDMLQITEVGKSGDSGVITANGKSGDPSWKTGENIYVKSATPKSATASSGKTTGPAFDRLNETIKALRSNPDEFYVSLHHDEYLTDSNLVKLAKNGESLAELQKLRDGVVSEIERAKGLKRLTPKSGDTFDYAIHDEKGTVPTPDKSLDGKVAETLTEGWTGKDGRKAQVSRYKYDPAAKPVESKLSTVNSEIAAVKARRDARLKSTTTKGTKQRGSADFTKDDFNDALELAELYVKKAGLTFEQYAKEMVDYFGDGVKPHLKEIWDTHAPVKVVPKVSAPKVEPNGEDVTGVAKQVTGRDPMKGASKAEMADRGRQIIEKDINAVANAIDAVEKKGVPMTPDEVSAAGYRLRQIENKQSEIRAAIEKTNDSAELANLNNLQQGLELEVERILKATDYSLNVGFHQYGMAAQIAYKPDFSLAALKSRAKGALLGTVEVVPKHIETKLASYASTIDQLRADLEAARKQIGDLIHKGSYKRGTKESNVKRLRQFFGEDGGAYQPMGSKSSKQRGAIYTLPNEERDAMAAMRSLAKQLADEGAGSLDEIVSGIRKEIGKNIPEETIYRMLSDKYRKYLLESDVQRMDANRYLRDIQRAAEFKLRTPLEKAVEATSDILGATARSFQAGWDISAPFIQGRKGLIVNPVGWMKSWESQLKALKTGDAVVNERLAEMERHPLYPRFVAAGGDKLMRRPGGVFHAQEEVFGTNFMRLASDTMSNAGPIGKYNPVNLYLKGLEHSDAAFSAFMNDLTWDTFVKFAKANPSDPAFLRDTVANLGIIYGRGTGPVAEAIGRSKMGNYFYAPRYTLSQMQYAGTPIRVMNPGSYETTAGRMQALRTYGTQAVAYGTLVAIAKLNGWDIETDLRSSDFGTVALPGGRRLDIFGKESQAYRLVANIFAGRVTKKNEYEKPGIVTAWKSVGQFGFGKLAPGPRLPSDVLFGSFDPDKGATPFTMAEFGKRYLPLWVQQTLQNGDMATIPMAILGQDVSKDQKAKLTPEQRSKSHPMELPKIKGKPDPLGRPYDPKAQVNDGDVIKEVQRLGIELKWPDTAEGETEAEYKTRAQKQGDAVRDAIRSQMATSLYKNATITEKREMVKSEISATKRTFNKDFNEAEKTRKADERLKQIERELATGRK